MAIQPISSTVIDPNIDVARLIGPEGTTTFEASSEAFDLTATARGENLIAAGRKSGLDEEDEPEDDDDELEEDEDLDDEDDDLDDDDLEDDDEDEDLDDEDDDLEDDDEDDEEDEDEDEDDEEDEEEDDLPVKKRK